MPEITRLFWHCHTFFLKQERFLRGSTVLSFFSGVRTMKFRQHDRTALAELLKTNSVVSGHFILSSGQTSAVYVNVKKTSLTGHGAHLIGLGMWQLAHTIDPQITAAGGLTLGADPILTAMAIIAYQNQARLDAIIVRKSPKKHGTMQFLELPEGLKPGQPVIVIDDVITTAGSTLEAIDRLRDAGFVVQHALCVVERQAGGQQALLDVGVQLHSLFLLDDLL